jgi:hypothetical protein
MIEKKYRGSLDGLRHAFAPVTKASRGQTPHDVPVPGEVSAFREYSILLVPKEVFGVLVT